MLNEKKIVPKLRQEVKVKVDIVTNNDIKIYYTGEFQDFTSRYKIKHLPTVRIVKSYNDGECSLTLYKTTNFRLFQTERVCRRQFQI